MLCFFSALRSLNKIYDHFFLIFVKCKKKKKESYGRCLCFLCCFHRFDCFFFFLLNERGNFGTASCDVSVRCGQGRAMLSGILMMPCNVVHFIHTSHLATAAPLLLSFAFNLALSLVLLAWRLCFAISLASHFGPFRIRAFRVSTTFHFVLFLLHLIFRFRSFTNENIHTIWMNE